MARLARYPWRLKMSMRELKDEDETSLKEDKDKVAALEKKNFYWEEGRRPLEEEEGEWEGPGYSEQELVEKLRKVLQGTLNTSAPGPDKVSYPFIKAVIDTIFGKKILI